MRSCPSRAWIAAIALAVAFGVLMQIPHWIYQNDPRYQGVPLKFNSDEEVYIARVEEALNGRSTQADEAFIGDSTVRGSQPAMIERVVGKIFRGSGLDAADALRVMDSVGVVLVFLLLFWFFLQCRFSPWSSLVATTAFCVIELYNLQRPIHQGLSLVLMLLALNFLIAGLERWKWWGVLGGAFFGLLFGDYVWSWSFGVIWAGLLLCTLWYERWKYGEEDARTRRLIRLFVFLTLAAAVAATFLWQLLSLLHHPLYEAVAFRSGMHPSHLPESIPYYVLFLTMATGVTWEAFRRPALLAKHRYAVVMIVTAFIASNQQIVHGQTFNFVSHYLLLMAVGAMCAVQMAWSMRHRVSHDGRGRGDLRFDAAHHRLHRGYGGGLRWPTVVVAIAACVYLGALAWDGRYALDHFRVIDRFGEQHLASALDELRLLPRATVLSDPQTSMLIAGTTVHDVVYALYLKNVLLSHEDIATRYCLSVAPVPASERGLEQNMLIWPDANAAFTPRDGTESETRMKELLLVQEACTRVDRSPKQWMDRYGVTYVLWDEKRRPEGNPKNLRVGLRLLKKGDGWSLWSR